jgi:hypothetical protein
MGFKMFSNVCQNCKESTIILAHRICNDESISICLKCVDIYKLNTLTVEAFGSFKVGA